tara:strand:- start:4481 stop:5503 length:1023 start_codon:yes stop_codon:yes gene_type:complete
MWLKSLGANVIGISIDIPTEPSHFRATQLEKLIEDYRLDIRDTNALNNLIKKLKPSFVFHLAAKALVRPSYLNPLETISTNAYGTISLLEALRGLEEKTVAIIITSDKVYTNKEWIWGYRETDRIGGQDPYSASKGMAEIAINSYVKSFFNDPNSHIRIGIGRAGNVIGGGDWAKDRLIPDVMKAASNNKAVNIRYPSSTRPWQHVMEPISGYLTLASNLYSDREIHGGAFNFGPLSNQNFTVSELIEEMQKNWGKIKWNDDSVPHEQFYEAGLLKLDIDKAISKLNWYPVLSFEETISLTVEWYRKFYEDKKTLMNDITSNQIDRYIAVATDRNLNWTS